MAAIRGRDGSPFLPRQKQGAIDFIGSVSVFFGTATLAQIGFTHKKISKLHKLSEGERRYFNLHTEAHNATVCNLRLVHSAIPRLKSALSLASAITRHFSLKTLQVEGETRILETIFLQLALSDFGQDNETLKLEIALQQVSQTQVSPHMTLVMFGLGCCMAPPFIIRD